MPGVHTSALRNAEEGATRTTFQCNKQPKDVWQTRQLLVNERRGRFRSQTTLPVEKLTSLPGVTKVAQYSLGPPCIAVTVLVILIVPDAECIGWFRPFVLLPAPFVRLAPLADRIIRLGKAVTGGCIGRKVGQHEVPHRLLDVQRERERLEPRVGALAREKVRAARQAGGRIERVQAHVRADSR